MFLIDDCFSAVRNSWSVRRGLCANLSLFSLLTNNGMWLVFLTYQSNGMGNRRTSVCFFDNHLLHTNTRDNNKAVSMNCDCLDFPSCVLGNRFFCFFWFNMVRMYQSWIDILGKRISKCRRSKVFAYADAVVLIHLWIDCWAKGLHSIVMHHPRDRNQLYRLVGGVSMYPVALCQKS